MWIMLGLSYVMKEAMPQFPKAQRFIGLIWKKVKLGKGLPSILYR